MAPMTLARTWTRQLGAASSVALIVPCAMVAALVALALGGGFGGLGVLGQVFAGPSIPNAGSLVAGGSATREPSRGASSSIPVIPVARFVAATHGGAAGRGVASSRTGVTRPSLPSAGGAIGQGGVTARPVTHAPVPTSSTPPAAAAPAPASANPSPSPTPSPQPAPVDTIVNTVTSVTGQVTAPAGPGVTQAVESVGSAANGVTTSLP